MTQVFFHEKSSPRVELPGSMHNFAVRVTLPFVDVSGVVRRWALAADKLLCYEHTGSVTEKVHVHLLLIGCGVTADRLKQYAKECGIEGTGNKFWSFKTKSKVAGPLTAETARRYITYMSKGQYDPLYVKGYDDEFLAECKAEWQQPEEVVSKYERMYNDFEDYMYRWLRDRPQKCIPGTYLPNHQVDGDVVASLARSWSFSLHRDFWTLETAKVAKLSFITYCMRNNIVVPDKYKVW